MKTLALCLAAAACTLLAGCIVVPDHHWHHGYRYGALDAPATSRLA